VYTLAERYLDLEEGDVHVFFPFPWTKHQDHDAGEAEAGATGSTRDTEDPGGASHPAPEPVVPDVAAAGAEGAVA
jgi:hypothetical protein